MVVVEAIAHDEVVADLHADVVDGVGVLEVVWLEEQRGDAHVGGLQVAEFLRGVTQGVARVDDVLHDDHVSTVQGMVEADEFADDVGGLGAGVGRQLDERDFTGDRQPLEQLGGEHEGAVEDDEKQWIHAVHVAVDLVGHGLDAVFDFFLRDEQPKFLV